MGSENFLELKINMPGIEKERLMSGDKIEDQLIQSFVRHTRNLDFLLNIMASH